MNFSYLRINLLRHPVLDFLDTLFVSVGSAFFCSNPLTGILLVVAFAIYSPVLAFMALAGGVSACLTAILFKRDRDFVKVGFFGYNGVLIGMYWTMLAPLGTASFLIMLLAAAVTVPLMILLNRVMCMSRFNLPALSLASLIVIFPAVWIVQHFQIAFPPTFTHPPGFGRWFEGEYLATPQELMYTIASLKFESLLIIGIVLLAISLHSRKTMFATVRGYLAGLAIAYILGGRSANWWTGLYLVTTIPVSMALDGFFLVPNMTTRIVTLFSMFAGTGVWILSVNFFENNVGMPEFTVPFFLTTTLILFASHLKIVQKLLPGVRPVPLIYVFSPEFSDQWLRDLQVAERYWQIVAPIQVKNNWEGDMKSKIDRAVDLIVKSRSIVVFTGAGVSTESDIPDFRTHEIHWKQYDTSHFRYERFATSEESRAKYWEMSQDFYLLIKQARPNRAHLAITELEKMGKLAGIITQNVDRLHHKAGVSAEKIVELHGNELFVSCLRCGKKYPRDEIYDWILNGVKVPYCLECQGILKPDSIAFGQPMTLELSTRAYEMTMKSDLFIIMGTSLLVQPAALLPWKAKQNGARLMIINLSSTVYDEHADVLIRDKAGRFMGKVMERIEEVRDYIQI